MVDTENKSIYHLHIPRTSGVFIRDSIIPNLLSKNVPIFASNREKIYPDLIKKCKFVSSHMGIYPIDIMDNPSVFCIVREPVSRWISYFKYTTGIARTKEEISEKLDRWLYGDQAEVQSNMQSKMLTGKINIDKFNNDVLSLKNKVGNGWFIEDYSLDLKEIKNNVDKYNCFTLENQKEFINLLNIELKNNFGIIIKNNYIVNQSRNIDLTISQNQIKRIKELNSIDMEIYNYVKSKE